MKLTYNSEAKRFGIESHEKPKLRDLTFPEIMNINGINLNKITRERVGGLNGYGTFTNL